MSCFNIKERLTPATHGVYFWARRLKPRLQEFEKFTPRRGSFMHGLIAKYQIEPSAVPIEAKTSHGSPIAEDDPALQAEIGLAALAGNVSIDKISRDFSVDKQFIKK